MTTLNDLIQETRAHLMTGQAERLNQLSAAITPSSTELSFEHEPKGITEGTRLAIGLEMLYVVSITGVTAGSLARVIRGFAGTTAASHATGTIIRVNPQFTDFGIYRWINRALERMSAPDMGLFRILSTEFNHEWATDGYDLPATNFLSVWRVRTKDANGEWHTLPRRDFTVDNAASVSSYASGRRLLIRQSRGLPGYPIQVSYKAGFSTLPAALSTDILTTSGLHTEAHDILPLYSAISLLAGREIKRSFLNRQPEPRRQEEVPPGAANQAMRPILQLLDDRLASEAGRLMRLYPEQI